jgi:hypothetical protein
MNVVSFITMTYGATKVDNVSGEREKEGEYTPEELVTGSAGGRDNLD